MTTRHKRGGISRQLSDGERETPLTRTADLDDGLARNPSEHQRRATLALTYDRFGCRICINFSMVAVNGQPAYSTRLR